VSVKQNHMCNGRNKRVYKAAWKTVKIRMKVAYMHHGKTRTVKYKSKGQKSNETITHDV
jgi:hypothetical protein